MELNLLDPGNVKYDGVGFHSELAKPLPNQDSYVLKEKMLERQALGKVAVEAPDIVGDEVDWRKIGSCAGSDTAVFYPEDDKDEGIEAKGICAHCPVRDACLQYALDTREKNGVWGGHTARDRRRIVRDRQKAARKAKASQKG